MNKTAALVKKKTPYKELFRAITYVDLIKRFNLIVESASSSTQLSSLWYKTVFELERIFIFGNKTDH